MKIQVLHDSVINKIAAGEVVERPVSVVRELVDNAVDAGANSVTVLIDNGGRTSIIVIDNGSGMGRDDALLAFERHATSKISAASDLSSIASYGFRGEALASIAAVSSIRLQTRLSEDSGGTEIQIRGGALKSVDSVAAPTGTRIEVKNLFYNVPARKKFLRQQATEERRIKSWLTQFSLANPSTHFRLCFDGRDALILPAAPDFEARARRLIRGSSAVVCSQEGDVSVAGLVGHPSLAQYDAGSLTILVNGRVVSDSMLLKAVREGFESTLKEREVPTGCVSISVPAAVVDVNVHPQKSEVRFLHPSEVFQAVRTAVYAATREFRRPVSAFPAAGLISENSPGTRYACAPSQPATLDQSRPFNSSSQPQPERPSTGGFRTTANEPQTTLYPASSLAELPSTAPFRYSDLRYIGQALQCYLICEWQTQLIVVDMHAAHERINFNLIRKAYRDQTVSSQQLLLPVSVPLSAEACDTIEQQAVFLERFGFEIDRFAEDAIVIRAVPGMLIDSDIAEFLKFLAAQDLFLSVDGALNERIDAMAARVACHASIRSGYMIKREEAYALFSQLDSSEFSAACPHGRPVVVTFSTTAVEKWFGRDR